MNHHASILTGLALLLALPSCSGPQVKVVEANPDAMYEFSTQPRGQVLIRHRDEDGNATTVRSSSANNGDNISPSRFRLPNMESLPDEQELKSAPDESSGGGVIARPPSE